MSKKLLFVLILCLFSLHFLQAQNAIVTGNIKNITTTEILPFVNITTKINDALTGTQTDFDGNYTIELPPGSHTLQFSVVGYNTETRVVALNAAQTLTLNIEMTEKKEILETVVINSSKFEQKLGEQVVSLEVIKPSLIENSNTTAIDNALQKVPGVDVIDGQANIRGGSGYSYGAGSRVMLLMDDLPILTADAGFPDWSFLPVENISQIEIIKGASSALYGSSAMNGIVNLRTAYPKTEPETKLSFFTSALGNPPANLTNDILYDANNMPVVLANGDTAFQKKAWWGGEIPFETGFSFGHRQKFKQLDFVSGLYLLSSDSHRQTDFSRRARANINLRYRVPTVPGLAIGLNLNTMITRSTSFLIWNRNNGQPGQPGYVGDAGAYQLWTNTPQINNKGRKLSVDPFIEYFTRNNIRIKLLGRYYINHNRNDTNQSTLSDFYYSEGQFQKRFPKLNLTTTAGITYSLAKTNAELYASDTINKGKYQATNLAGYVQLDKKFYQKLNLSLGARFERNTIESESEAKPVLRAGVNYQAAEYTYIRASYGQAYRFPTIAEKFVDTQLGGVNVGALTVPIGIFPNPSLKSETGWSAELGVKQGFAISEWKGLVDVAAFINEYSNMMEFTFGASNIVQKLVQSLYWPEYDTTVIVLPDPNGIAVGFQSLNIGDTRIFGLDASVVGQGSLFGAPTTLLAGYTWTNPKFKDFDKVEKLLSSSDENVLKYRFRHTAKLDAETRISKLSFGLGVRYFSFMEAIDEAFAVFLPGVRQFREEHNTGDLIVDARILFHVSENSTLSFLCNNLFNREYAMRPALMDSPRQFTVKYALDLKGKPK